MLCIFQPTVRSGPHAAVLNLSTVRALCVCVCVCVRACVCVCVNLVQLTAIVGCVHATHLEVEVLVPANAVRPRP